MPATSFQAEGNGNSYEKIYITSELEHAEAFSYAFKIAAICNIIQYQSQKDKFSRD